MCLEKAADRLLDYLNMLPKGYSDLRQHTIKAHGGEMIATGLVNNEIMSISRTHFTHKGMTSDWHSHASAETLILQKGAPYFVEIRGLSHCIKVTESKSCHIPQGVPHRLAGTEGESWSIVVLVPGSDTFPKGVENGE